MTLIRRNDFHVKGKIYNKETMAVAVHILISIPPVAWSLGCTSFINELRENYKKDVGFRFSNQNPTGRAYSAPQIPSWLKRELATAIKFYRR